MNRREPPPLATWMLEHLTAGERDEALGGDLLEEFSSGRSDGWYWRQVLTAFVVSWLRALRGRASMLMFALLWSMLAPAWKVVCDRIQDSPALDHVWQIFGGLWLIPALAAWTVLHSTFLWAGALVYVLANRALGKLFQGQTIRRAFWLAPLILVPIYGVTFVLVNLYWYSVFSNARLAATPLSQIADIGRLADVLRLPYLIALVSALWGLTPQSMRAPRTVASEVATTEAEEFARLAAQDPYKLRRFFAFMICAGLVNSMIGGFLLCRLPPSNAPDLAALLVQAVAYVTVGALAGVAGTWLYWGNRSSPFRTNAPLPFQLFALVCAAGWVWVPAMVIFSEQLSPLTAFVAMVGAFSLAGGLRRATDLAFVPPTPVKSSWNHRDVELFDESLYRPPFEAHGYAIAVSLYAAAAALLSHSVYTAAVLIAFSTSLFAWKRATPQTRSGIGKRDVHRAAVRLVWVAILAVLVTAWALLDGGAHRTQAATVTNSSLAGLHNEVKHQHQPSAQGFDGYESVILWPIEQRHQITAPMIERTLLVPGTTRPLIIRFDGPYWFVQSPDIRPGPTAHQARGIPTNVNIQSSNTSPISMAAHQILSTPIPIARCREIEVEIENQDNRAGAISLALLLSNGNSLGSQTLYLGQQPVRSTEPQQFSIKASPVFETLRYEIPSKAKIRSFSKMTVQFLPDIEHEFVTPKIAILQFKLIPR